MKDTSGLVWIEVLMDFRARDGTQYYAEERCRVTPEDRARWCAAGWAQDPSGEVPTGDPRRPPATLEGVQSTRHVISDERGD